MTAPRGDGRAPNPPRLRRRAEFLRAAAGGRKAALPGVVVQVFAREEAHVAMPARFGFTVTKRVGNSVIRNRARRRLREAARLVLARAPLAGLDVVLIGRAGTLTRPFPALLDDVERALARAVARPRGSAAP